MLFCTQAFLIFFQGCIFVAYWLTSLAASRTYLLLVASFYFYSGE